MARIYARVLISAAQTPQLMLLVFHTALLLQPKWQLSMLRAQPTSEVPRLGEENILRRQPVLR